MTRMAEADTNPAKRPTRRWVLAAKIAVTLSVLGVIFAFIPVGEVWNGIRSTHPGVWLLVLGLFLAGHGVASMKWRLLAARDIHPLTVLKAHFAGLSANIALPGVAGGDITRAALLSRKTRSRSALVLGSLVDRLVDTAVLVLIAAIGAVLIGAELPAEEVLKWLALALCAGAVIAYVSLPALSGWIGRHAGRDTSSKIVRLADDVVRYVAEHRIRIAVCVLISFCIQTGFVGLNVLLSQSMGGPTSYAMWMFAWPLAKLIATLPISLGGLGVREASLVGVFSAAGTTSPLIISVGFVWQTILLSAGLLGLLLQAVGRSRPIKTKYGEANG